MFLLDTKTGGTGQVFFFLLFGRNLFTRPTLYKQVYSYSLLVQHPSDSDILHFEKGAAHGDSI